MYLKGPDIFQPEAVRRSAEMPRKLRNCMKVGTRVTGERLRIVVSSIIRRRRGLVSVIVISCLTVGKQANPSKQQRNWQISQPKCRDSGFVQSLQSHKPRPLILDERINAAVMAVIVVRVKRLIGLSKTGAGKIVLMPIGINQRKSTDMVEALEVFIGEF